ncbi:hypothetical protein [Actinophytocola xinjiangensis]|uniref:hypothetical protein n=1 Tax=Actinophytocola xinjiangensis TaxID=485602 RepID=UPI000946EBB8|nr:hypothetical protein [Actinophytocola xinjiangensis]
MTGSATFLSISIGRISKIRPPPGRERVGTTENQGELLDDVEAGQRLPRPSDRPVTTLRETMGIVVGVREVIAHRGSAELG